MKSRHYAVGINAIAFGTLTDKGAGALCRRAKELADGDFAKSYDILMKWGYNTAVHTIYVRVWMLGSIFGDVTGEELESFFKGGTFDVLYDENAINLK